MIQHFSFTIFPFFDFATQLFSTPSTSSNLRNQAPLFTELHLLQVTFIHNKKSIPKSCTSSLWHISDTSECWPMPSQCL